MTHAGARSCFPKMPPDLFDFWIQREIERVGWPFVGNETIVSHPSWSKYLRDHGPSFWSEVRWRLVREAFVQIPIERRAIDLCRALGEDGRQFVETGITKRAWFKDSMEKVTALAAVMERTRKFPKPLVCLIEGTDWWLMDGHHRLGALFMLEDLDQFQCDIWLGEHAL